MSDIKQFDDTTVVTEPGMTFSYNTAEGLGPESKENPTEDIKKLRDEPLDLYDDQLPLLSETMPVYDEALPNANMRTLIARMKMTMRKFGGIGLSANQCNVSTRMFLISHLGEEMVCINPKLIAFGQNDIKLDEGCLSFPGLILSVKRYEDIDVEYQDENGETVNKHLDGMLARCFQHELDHMNGIKFTSQVSNLVLSLAKKKQDKLMKTETRKQKNNFKWNEV
jgi:peptide deformylase